MKKLITLSILLTILVSCGSLPHPSLSEVGKLQVGSLTTKNVSVVSSAKFWNSEQAGGVIVTDNVEVFMSGSPVGKVAVKEVSVPTNQMFYVPLEASIPVENLKKGFLGSVINSIMNKNVSLQFRGNVSYKENGVVKKTYNINKYQDVKIN